MDPEFYEWHYVLQCCLRSKRRKHCYHHFQPNPLPSEEEKNAIMTANELYPLHPRYMLAENLILAECIKASHARTIRKGQSGQRSPQDKQEQIIAYKEFDFGKPKTIVSYIKERTK